MKAFIKGVLARTFRRGKQQTVKPSVVAIPELMPSLATVRHYIQQPGTGKNKKAGRVVFIGRTAQPGGMQDEFKCCEFAAKNVEDLVDNLRIAYQIRDISDIRATRGVINARESLVVGVFKWGRVICHVVLLQSQTTETGGTEAYRRRADRLEAALVAAGV